MHCQLFRTKCSVFIFITLSSGRSSYAFFLSFFTTNCASDGTHPGWYTPRAVLLQNAPDRTHSERRTPLTVHAPDGVHAAPRTPRAALALKEHATEGTCSGPRTSQTAHMWVRCEPRTVLLRSGTRPGWRTFRKAHMSRRRRSGVVRSPTLH